MPREATEEQRREHAHCNALLHSTSFTWYTAWMNSRAAVAQREVAAELSPSRDYHAGRLSAFLEAANFAPSRYQSLKPIVEVLPE